MQSTQALSEQFDRFARLEARGASPLYERLCLGVAGDSELLSLAAHARRGTAGAKPVNGGSSRIVQTNVVSRCSSLMPVFTTVAQRSKGKPISLVEIGASAGLNLLWDRHGYSYGNGLSCGDPASAVQLSCTLRGIHRPPVPHVLPTVVSRLGLDLNPIDFYDTEAAQWLIALVWPERGDERELLEAAIGIAQSDPPTVMPGDALELLPEVAKTVPQDSTLCMFHTHTLNQFSPEARTTWWEIVEQLGSERDVYVVSQEMARGGDHAVLELTWIEDGVLERLRLANCDSHSQWLEWLVPDAGMEHRRHPAHGV